MSTEPTVIARYLGDGIPVQPNLGPIDGLLTPIDAGHHPALANRTASDSEGLLDSLIMRAIYGLPYQ